jgi:DNA-binding transcriptional MerR regulator
MSRCLRRIQTVSVYDQGQMTEGAKVASATEELPAFPDTRARQLAGVSMGRLRYWEETGLVVPSIRRQLSPNHTVRLYSFTDLLSLLVVAQLRVERRMSLQHVRRVVEHLRSRGYHSVPSLSKVAIRCGAARRKRRAP